MKLYRAWKDKRKNYTAVTGMSESPFEDGFVAAHLLKCKRGFISVLVPEVIVHAKVSLSAQLVPGLAVWDALNHSTLRKWIIPEQNGGLEKSFLELK